MVGRELASLPQPPGWAVAGALLGSLPPLLATAEVPRLPEPPWLLAKRLRGLPWL